jgi:hypothetical protein
MSRVLDHLETAILDAPADRRGRYFAASFAQLSENERSTLLDLLLRIVGGRELETG